MGNGKRLVQCDVCVGLGRRPSPEGSVAATSRCGRCDGTGTVMVPIAKARDAVQVTPVTVRDHGRYGDVMAALAKLEAALGGTSTSVRDAIRAELLARGVVGVEGEEGGA